MPVDTQIRLAEGDHVVQFYDRDDDLVDVVVGYLAAALGDGDAVVVIATPGHRAAFAAALLAAGVVPSEEQLVVLDAQGTLAAFMDAGRPDATLFDAVVGEAVRRLAAAGRPVRAYGEMVAALWGDGNPEAALELERLWNGLGATIPFSLFCAYPSHMVGDGTHARREVCSLHSEVVGGTPPDVADEVGSFVRSPAAPRLARRFVCETLLAWGFRGLMDDAAVVVTELATNAVAHAESDFTVCLTRTAGGIRIAVADRSSVPPDMRAPDCDTPGGRGLVLVDNLAERWSHALTGEGKVVWAELAVPAWTGA